MWKPSTEFRLVNESWKSIPDTPQILIIVIWKTSKISAVQYSTAQSNTVVFAALNGMFYTVISAINTPSKSGL